MTPAGNRPLIGSAPFCTATTLQIARLGIPSGTHGGRNPSPSHRNAKGGLNARPSETTQSLTP